MSQAEEDKRREALKAYIARENVSVNAWAQSAGLNEATIRNFLKGRHRSLNSSTYQQLADARGTTVSELMGETVALDSVDVVGAVQAGVWSEALEWPEVDWYRAPVARDRRYAAYRQYGLEVRGPSMNELYPHGSIVVCVKLLDIGRDPKPSERVIVQRHSHEGFEATIKELRIDDEKRFWLWPRSNDPNFQQPWRLPLNDEDRDSEEISVVALVIGSYRPEG